MPPDTTLSCTCTCVGHIFTLRGGEGTTAEEATEVQTWSMRQDGTPHWWEDTSRPDHRGSNPKLDFSDSTPTPSMRGTITLSLKDLN